MKRRTLPILLLAVGCPMPDASDTEKAIDTGSTADSETGRESDSTAETGSESESGWETGESEIGTLNLDDKNDGAIVGRTEYATGVGGDLPVTTGSFTENGTLSILVGFRGAADTRCGGIGGAYVFRPPHGVTVSTEDAESTVCASDPDYAATGESVAAAGDVDGDGHEDLLVGAPTYDSIGRTYLVAGPPASVVQLGTEATATLIGHEPDDSSVYDAYSGWAVAGAGDINGDGLADVLIAEPGNNYVYVLNGPVSGTIDLRVASDAQLIGEGGGVGFGYAVDSAGDVDGDGLDDILVGSASDDYQYAWLFNGPLAGAIDSAAADVTFGPDGLRPGVVRGMGDLNGDGYPDVAMTSGDERAKQDGVMIFEAPFDPILDGEDAVAWIGGRADDQQYGLIFSNPGDFDGNGAADLAIQISQVTDYYSAAVALAFGPFAGTTDLDAAPLVLVSSDADDNVGTALASPGDADGDGFDDLLVSAGNDDTYGKNTGKVWLMSGATMSIAAGR